MTAADGNRAAGAAPEGAYPRGLDSVGAPRGQKQGQPASLLSKSALRLRTGPRMDRYPRLWCAVAPGGARSGQFGWDTGHQ